LAKKLLKEEALENAKEALSLYLEPVQIKLKHGKNT
jgi:predicted RNase H-like HicB family nuclease